MEHDSYVYIFPFLFELFSFRFFEYFVHVKAKLTPKKKKIRVQTNLPRVPLNGAQNRAPSLSLRKFLLLIGKRKIQTKKFEKKESSTSLPPLKSKVQNQRNIRKTN